MAEVKLKNSLPTHRKTFTTTPKYIEKGAVHHHPTKSTMQILKKKLHKLNLQGRIQDFWKGRGRLKKCIYKISKYKVNTIQWARHLRAVEGHFAPEQARGVRGMVCFFLISMPLKLHSEVFWHNNYEVFSSIKIQTIIQFFHLFNLSLLIL